MILRLYRSKSDIENLSKLRTLDKPENYSSVDFKRTVVNKPWGYEYLMFENNHVAVWVLYLNGGAQTSMHCHPNKKTSLIVVHGKIILSTLEGEYNLRHGDGLIIDDGVFHSSLARSKKGSYLIEVESPPIKRDLVRLKDDYGRQMQGYEGSDKMSRELKNYDYIDFHEDYNLKFLKNYGLSILHSNDIFKARGDLLCLLEGTILTEDEEIFLTCGEIVDTRDFKSQHALKNSGNLSWLLVTNGKKSI